MDYYWVFLNLTRHDHVMDIFVGLSNDLVLEGLGEQYMARN